MTEPQCSDTNERYWFQNEPVSSAQGTNPMTDTTIDHRAIFAEAQLAAQVHVREIAKEILIWRRTGTLPDGRLRDVAATLRQTYVHDALAIAEKLAVDAALEIVAAGEVERLRAMVLHYADQSGIPPEEAVRVCKL